MRRVSSAVFGLLILAAVAATPFAAGRSQEQAKQMDEEFSAILANISNIGGTGLVPVNIRINRWTGVEEGDRLLSILRDDGKDAFLRALLDVKPVGSIGTPGALRYDFFYATQARTKDGGRRIMLITDRPMQIQERLNASITREYPFTVVQLQLGKDDTGKGTLAQMVQLQLLGNILGVENLASAPMMLNEVKPVR